MGSSGKLSVWESFVSQPELFEFLSFHHSTSATSVIGKITREVASGVLRKHQKRWHGNSYIQVQQLLPRKSLSCKLVGKRPGLLLEAFPKDHYLSGSPMVIRDSMDQWPAKNKWNDMNYLRKVAGFRTVPIEPSRVGLNLCQDGAGCREFVLRCYRREVYSMSMERELPVTSGSSLEFTGVDVEGPCVASDLEKRKATVVMKECIQNELPRTVRMYYRKDGTSFWLHISPVRNASGKVGLVSNYDLLALDSESGTRGADANMLKSSS
ncbi:putative lysine-specific demethylase JMJD5 [Capsicum chinense]|nr:putative lysine-specific demethylase JMJD5 [Capsicum chinense]